MTFQITEVQKALKGVDYPASKDELADHAAGNGADRELVDALRGMDKDSFEQVHVPGEVMGDASRYLAESGEAQIAMHQGVPIAVELPASVVLAIVQTDPGAKGDTRTGAMKPAKMETGAVVQVPLFVEEGERVKVDTRSGEYIERVKS